MKPFLCFFPLLCFFACGPAIPTEAELRARIAGTYCLQSTENIFYQLSIEDSTYQMTKNVPSALRTGFLTEYCRGSYTLVFEAEEWYIHFSENQSPRRTTIHDCKRTFLLWNRAGEYVGGPEARIMKDLFDGLDLRAEACDEV